MPHLGTEIELFWNDMTHLTRLSRELISLLNSQRVASLGTIADDGSPFVSMVPFAIERQLGCLVIHVSSLAAHTRHLQMRERVSVLVALSEEAGKPVHALARVTLLGSAKVLVRDSSQWGQCKAVYLERFPDAQIMTELGDFMFVALDMFEARHVSGFGAARSVDQEEIKLVLGSLGAK
jgi:putative heme iron utilization protein